ncbi:hypothetical protein ACPVTF_02730 [Geobacillus icigianus]|uniref:Uncharacterized protein n=1 Tax=Geobacillus subterraneus TaxID=129338 RepID=A0A679FR24_9BACL|nr:hypothetical protein [Geobacillus subterraneus]BBW98553.1 hypothetical protein GsuE55_33860 [Geobacillus subterraneus]
MEQEVLLVLPSFGAKWRGEWSPKFDMRGVYAPLIHRPSRGHKEAQAEAVAFIVSKYYGLDTEPYSAGYIATWAKDIQLAKQAMKEIQHVAQGIIQEIDELMKERIKELRQMHESSKDQDKNNKNEKDKEMQLQR